MLFFQGARLILASPYNSPFTKVIYIDLPPLHLWSSFSEVYEVLFSGVAVLILPSNMTQLTTLTLCIFFSGCFPCSLTYQISLISLTSLFIREQFFWDVPGALWKITVSFRSKRLHLVFDFGKSVKNIKKNWTLD